MKPIRRRSLKVLLVTMLIAALTIVVGPTISNAQRAEFTTMAAAAAVEPGQFSLAIIPDTQQEVIGQDQQRFANRTQWLVDNKASLNLAFVLHTGDMMNWDTADHGQYKVGSAAMKKLDDAGIPWIPAIGNHDTAAVCAGGAACPGQSAHDNLRRTQTYNQYFPTSRFPRIGGTFEPGKVDNTYSTFSAGNSDWLAINLELWPRSSVIDWAKNVVEQHPKHNVIITTHSYLNPGGSIDQTNGGYGDTSAQYMYDNLVRPYSNVKFVFSGHVGDAGYRKDVRPDGSTVVSFLGAFHSNTTNPVQILTVDTAAGTASTRFYAPKDGTTWPQYAVSVTGLTWATPPSPSAPSAPAGPTGSVIALRSTANNMLVTADPTGATPLIANRTAIGGWEQFVMVSLGGNEIGLRALANQQYVCADSAGAASLIANRPSVLGWETFELINNPDGTISLRSRANNLLVTAENAGSSPLIANRTVINGWEKFVIIPQ